MKARPSATTKSRCQAYNNCRPASKVPKWQARTYDMQSVVGQIARHSRSSSVEVKVAKPNAKPGYRICERDIHRRCQEKSGGHHRKGPHLNGSQQETPYSPTVRQHRECGHRQVRRPRERTLPRLRGRLRNRPVCWRSPHGKTTLITKSTALRTTAGRDFCP